MKIAIYPGSFDPITKGHQAIALRAASLFSHLIVAVGQNSDKRSMFSVEQRLEFITKTFENVKNISVVAYEGLTVDFCKQNQINYIVRGVRSDMDWGVESSIAAANKILYPSIETVFLLTEHQYIGISSSVVRDILNNKGDVSAFLPKEVMKLLVVSD
jgi:pantetheine-phosphate adenylyltransferase